MEKQHQQREGKVEMKKGEPYMEQEPKGVTASQPSIAPSQQLPILPSLPGVATKEAAAKVQAAEPEEKEFVTPQELERFTAKEQERMGEEEKKKGRPTPLGAEKTGIKEQPAHGPSKQAPQQVRYIINQ